MLFACNDNLSVLGNVIMNKFERLPIQQQAGHGIVRHVNTLHEILVMNMNPFAKLLMLQGHVCMGLPERAFMPPFDLEIPMGL